MSNYMLKVDQICYDNYYFGGMHFLWWFVWLILLFWIFVIPFDIPGERRLKNSPMDILKRRLAAGEITNEEFLEKKAIIEKN